MSLFHPIIDMRRRLPRASGKAWTKRQASDIKGAVLHHTASDMELYPTADFHIGLGSPTLRYTFWVDVTGEVILCNEVTAVVASQGGQGSRPPVPFTQSNTNFVSVALRGDLSSRSPTKLQQLALSWFWAWLRENYSIHDDMLLGHGEFKATECPGAGGRALIQQLTEGARGARGHQPRTVLEVQRALLRLGHELPRWGDDGLWGGETQVALKAATGLDEINFDSTYDLGARLAGLQSGDPRS